MKQSASYFTYYKELLVMIKDECGVAVARQFEFDTRQRYGTLTRTTMTPEIYNCIENSAEKTGLIKTMSAVEHPENKNRDQYLAYVKSQRARRTYLRFRFRHTPFYHLVYRCICSRVLRYIKQRGVIGTDTYNIQVRSFMGLTAAESHQFRRKDITKAELKYVLQKCKERGWVFTHDSPNYSHKYERLINKWRPSYYLLHKIGVSKVNSFYKKVFISEENYNKVYQALYRHYHKQ